MQPGQLLDELGDPLPAGLSASIEGDALKFELTQSKKSKANGWRIAATILGLAGGTIAIGMWTASLIRANEGVTFASVITGGLAFVLGILTFVAVLVSLLWTIMKESLWIEAERVVWGNKESKVALLRQGVLAARVVSKRDNAAGNMERKPSAAVLELEAGQGFLRLCAMDWDAGELACIGRAIQLAWDVPFSETSERNTASDDKPRVQSGWDRRAWLACVAGLAFCIGFFTYILATTVPAGLASKKWPTVEGEAIKVRYDTSGESTIAEMTYRYTINGTTYENDRIHFTSFSDAAEVKALFKSRNTGSAVRVFYDPDDPSNAVLVPGVHPLHLCVVIGLALTVFAMIAVLRSRPPPEATDMQAMYVAVEVEKKTKEQNPPTNMTRRGKWLSCLIVTGVCGWLAWRLCTRVQEYMTDEGWTRELIIVQTGAVILACMPLVMLRLVFRKDRTGEDEPITNQENGEAAD